MLSCEYSFACSQTVASLEAQVRSLSDQVHEGRALSQKELAEARVHWEEERLDLLQYQETAVSVCVWWKEGEKGGVIHS